MRGLMGGFPASRVMDGDPEGCEKMVYLVNVPP